MEVGRLRLGSGKLGWKKLRSGGVKSWELGSGRKDQGNWGSWSRGVGVGGG